MWIYNEPWSDALPSTFALALSRLLCPGYGHFYPEVTASLGWPHPCAEHVAKSFAGQCFCAVCVCPGP